MRIRLGRLRQLIREEARDTIMAPTQYSEPSPESMRRLDMPAMRSNDPLQIKVDQVIKILNHDHVQVDARDVKKLLSTVDPKRLLVMKVDAIAKQVQKKLAN